jgi:hypothetical protein
MSKHEYVNGPINVVRLEGKVGTIKKVIYVFISWPISADDQTKCDDIRAVDVSTYLVRQFDQLKKSKPNSVYDFMYSRGPLVPDFKSTFRGTYQNQVAEIFAKSFEIDLDENKVKKSSLIPNVRFHYMGVIDYVFLNTPNIIFNRIHPIVSDIWHNRSYNLNDMIALHNDIKIIGDEVMQIYYLCFEEKKLTNPKLDKSVYSAKINKKFDISVEDSQKLVRKLIYKLKYAYDNKSVGNTMNTIINTEFKDMLSSYFSDEKIVIETIVSEIEFLKKLGDHKLTDILHPQKDGSYDYHLSDDIMDEKILFFKKMHQKILSYGSNFIDSFLMSANLIRRFLDKNYITNGVTYLNAYSAINLIRLLVKHFGFEITNWSYLKNNDLAMCKKMIAESKKYSDLNVIFLPVLLDQCADLGSFIKPFD